MTQPAWMQAHDERALAFEEQAEQHVSAALRLALADAARRLAVEYIKAAGSLTTPVPAGAQDGLRVAVRRIVVALATGLVSELPAIAAALDDVIVGGLQLGTKASGRRARRLKLKASDELTAVADGIGRRLRDDMAAARKAAESANLRRYRDVTAVLAKASQAVNNVSKAARWAANRAVTDGVLAVAGESSAAVLWIAERDACLSCYAYSGLLAEHGELFPAGLTYGKTSTVKEPVDGPPAHPNCRCRIQVWYGTEPRFGVELPTALKREAERAVLRGDSNFASAPAKMRAADQLLATGLSGLPDTVKLKARRKVQAGPGAWRTPVKTAPRSRP